MFKNFSFKKKHSTEPGTPKTEEEPCVLTYQQVNKVDDIPLNLPKNEFDNYIIELFGRGSTYNDIYRDYIEKNRNTEYKVWFLFHIIENAEMISNEVINNPADKKTSMFQFRIDMNTEDQSQDSVLLFNDESMFNTILAFIKSKEEYSSQLMGLLNTKYSIFKHTSLVYIRKRIRSTIQTEDGTVTIDIDLPLCNELFMDMHKHLKKVQMCDVSMLCEQIDTILLSKYNKEHQSTDVNRTLDMIFKNKTLLGTCMLVILSLLLTNNLKFIIFYILDSRDVDFVFKIFSTLSNKQIKAFLYTYNPEYASIIITNLLSICIKRKAIDQVKLYQLLDEVIAYDPNRMSSVLKANICVTMGIELWKGYKDKMDVQSYITSLWSTKDIVIVDTFRELLEPHKELCAKIDEVLISLFKEDNEKTLQHVKSKGHLFSLLTLDTIEKIKEDPEVNTDVNDLSSFSNQLLLSSMLNPNEHQKLLVSSIGISSDYLLTF